MSITDILYVVGGGAAGLLLNITANKVPEKYHAPLLKWGWFAIALYFTLLIMTIDAIQQRIRLPGRPTLISYAVAGLIACLVGLAYWFFINAAYSRLSDSKPTEPVFHLSRKFFVVTEPSAPAFYFKYTKATREGIGTFLAPIALAMNIEVINNRPTQTKIKDYFADIEIEDRWYRLGVVPTSFSQDIYFANDFDLRTAWKADFLPGLFDPRTIEVLNLGTPIEGWVFFEWPASLREQKFEIEKVKVRLTIKNSQNESADRIVLSPEAYTTTKQNGAKLLGGGFARGDVSELDLSKIPIKAFNDY